MCLRPPPAIVVFLSTVLGGIGLVLSRLLVCSPPKQPTDRETLAAKAIAAGPTAG